MLHQKLTLLAACLIVICAPVAGQTVDEILAKHVASLGGREKIDAIKTLKVTGHTSRRGMEITTERWLKLPGKVRLETKLPGRKMVQAYDGEIAWGIMPSRGGGEAQVRVLEARRAQMVLSQVEIFGPLVNPKNRGLQIKSMGKQDFEGTEVVVMQLTDPEGRVTNCFLDTEYYVELKREIVQTDGEGNENKVTTFFSDYKEVAGVMLPHAIKTEGGLGRGGRGGSGGRRGRGAEMVIDKIEVNVAIDDAIFKKPETNGK